MKPLMFWCSIFSASIILDIGVPHNHFFLVQGLWSVLLIWLLTSLPMTINLLIVVLLECVAIVVNALAAYIFMIIGYYPESNMFYEGYSMRMGFLNVAELLLLLFNLRHGNTIIFRPYHNVWGVFSSNTRGNSEDKAMDNEA